VTVSRVRHDGLGPVGPVWRKRFHTAEAYNHLGSALAKSYGVRMQLNSSFTKSTIVAALGGLLFGFDTAVISGTTARLTQAYELSPRLLGGRDRRMPGRCDPHLQYGAARKFAVVAIGRLHRVFCLFPGCRDLGLSGRGLSEYGSSQRAEPGQLFSLVS
jgi:hypothetical protein